MATSFPTGLDAIQRVAASDLRNAPGKEGHVLHNNVCDAIEALQAKVGIDGSADGASIDKRLANFVSKNPVCFFKPFGSYESSAGVLNYTMNVAMIVPVDFIGLRIRFYNVTTAAIINCTAGVAASKNVTGGIYAATETPVQVTVGGATTFTRPVAVSGGGTANAVASEVISDWITCSSVPRDDGGLGRILIVRTYDPSAGNTTCNRSGGNGVSAADLNAYGLAASYGSSDRTFTTWASYSQAGASLAPAISVELLSLSGVFSVAAFGDSTMAGQGSAVWNASGLVLSAMGSLSDQLPVAAWNCGESSMTSATYTTMAETAISSGATLPNAAAICPWSPNDTDKYTQAGVNRTIGNAIRFMHACRTKEIAPILVTPCPRDSITAGEEGFRRQVVNAVKALASAFGAGIIDRDALYTNYSAAEGGFLPGLSSDGTHPSSTGYAAESQLWDNAISALIP